VNDATQLQYTLHRKELAEGELPRALHICHGPLELRVASISCYPAYDIDCKRSGCILGIVNPGYRHVSTGKALEFRCRAGARSEK
jgi:hypothetical protein